MENKKASLELAREFLLTAKADLKSAEIELKGKIYNNSVYHAQQAVEKAIKALLILHNKFVETHFVADRLRDLIEDREVIEKAKSLERNWIICRYPFVQKREIWSPVKAFTESDAKEALNKAKFVFRKISRLLKERGVEV